MTFIGKYNEIEHPKANAPLHSSAENRTNQHNQKAQQGSAASKAVTVAQPSSVGMALKIRRTSKG